VLDWCLFGSVTTIAAIILGSAAVDVGRVVELMAMWSYLLLSNW